VIRGGLTAVPPALLGVREVAARLGVSTATVYKLCERGTLPHVRVLNGVIRVEVAALAAFVRTRGGAR
jgi:excisionase family DNA binding protein